MKKVVLFPYHYDMYTIVEHRDALVDYEIIGFTSYKEDATRIHALNEQLGGTDITYNELLQDCDAVILLDNYRNFKPDKYYRVIEDAQHLSKEIYITPLAQSQLDLKDYQDKYKLLERIPEEAVVMLNKYEQISEKKLYEIDVPIIGVFGAGKCCEKFRTQLLLNEVISVNYNGVAVTSNSLGALFGCYTIPSFFFENSSFQDKIIKFNHYIRFLVEADRPDVIVLGAPEGIAPFSRKEFHHFAEYPLAISSAVPIDLAVMCTYFLAGSTLEQGLRKIQEHCKHKFSTPIEAFVISRTLYEIPDADYKSIIYEFPDEEFLAEHYPNIDSIGLRMINPMLRERAIETIENCLKLLGMNVRDI